jgi:hypothetical protein
MDLKFSRYPAEIDFGFRAFEDRLISKTDEAGTHCPERFTVTLAVKTECHNMLMNLFHSDYDPSV